MLETRTVKFRVLASVIVLALVVIGCVQATPQPPAATEPPDVTPTKAAEPTSTPVPEEPEIPQEIVVALSADPDTMDPAATVANTTFILASHVFDTLVDLDYETREIVPRLAESWQVGADGSWEFRLRKGVKFHNGDDFTAEDVKFTLDRIIDPESTSPFKFYVTGFQSVEVIDDYTVKIVTDKPSPLVPLNMVKVHIVPARYVQQQGDEAFAQNPVGTGPFKFVEWVRDDHISLEANPDYWDGAPKLQKATFRPIPEPSTRVAALLTGEADLIADLLLTDVESVNANPEVSVAESPSLRLVYIILDSAHHESPVFNKLVRQAVNYAIDKQAIVDSIMQGYATVLQGQLLSPEYFGFNPELGPYPYDPQKASELLAQAGYPDGFTAKLITPDGRYPMDKEVSQVVAAQLAEIGIDITVQVVESTGWVKLLLDKECSPMGFVGMAVQPDADVMLSIQRTGNISSYYSNPEFDALLEQARTTFDKEERLSLYKETTEIHWDDPPGIFMYQQHDLYGVRNDVAGWEPRPDQLILLRDVYRLP